jgi:hypothetical protein
MSSKFPFSVHRLSRGPGAPSRFHAGRRAPSSTGWQPIYIQSPVSSSVSCSGPTPPKGRRARALKTVVINDVRVAESAPVIGIALEAMQKDGYIWVLVNPQ